MADAWMPGAVHVPITTNIARGQMGAVVGMTLHHMVGPYESADSRFRTPGSNASAHFGTTAGGIVFQWVAIGDAAYAQCQGNYEGQVSVENESPAFDDPTTADNELWAPLTPEQVMSDANIARWLHLEHGMALRVADPNDRRGVGYHSMCPGPCASPHAWGQTGCPGPAVASQCPQVVDLAAGPVVPPIDWAALVRAALQAEEEHVRFATETLTDGRTLIAVRGVGDGVFYKFHNPDGSFTPAQGWSATNGSSHYTPQVDALPNGGAIMLALATNNEPFYAYLEPGGTKFSGFATLGGAVAG